MMGNLPGSVRPYIATPFMIYINKDRNYSTGGIEDNVPVVGDLTGPKVCIN